MASAPAPTAPFPAAARPSSPAGGSGARPVLPAALAAVLLAFAMLATAAAPARATGAELVLFETEGCPFCIRWHRQVGPVYPKTAEAKVLPLRRVELRDGLPPDLRHVADIRYTPTFVAMVDGREIGRIVGYAGEDSFWSQLAPLAEKARASRVPLPPAGEEGARAAGG